MSFPITSQLSNVTQLRQLVEPAGPCHLDRSVSLSSFIAWFKVFLTTISSGTDPLTFHKTVKNLCPDALKGSHDPEELGNMFKAME